MKYLLWDFDNTLVYRDGMWGNTICELLSENGYGNLKIDNIKPYLNNGFLCHSSKTSHREFFKGKNWWKYMNEHFVGIDDNIANNISEGIREKYLVLDKWHVYDDTVLCLKSAIEKGYSNIVLSNHVPELEELVKRLEIRDYFIKIYSSAYIGYEKLNIKAFKKVFMDLRNVESITMIGDNHIADVQGAKIAGIDVILVRKNNDYNYDKYFAILNELANFILFIL